MDLVLAFAATLVVAVLVSARADRTVLSTAGLFLAVGVVLGSTVLGSARETEAIGPVAELALFSVLFTDGMRIGVRDLVSAWRLPGRLLLLAMPLTFVLIALLTSALTGLGTVEALLLAAVLTPTDPVFAAAIVGREQVPGRLRHLLNVESGLNDGLALPVVVVLLAAVADQPTEPLVIGGELALGVAVGVGVPLAAIYAERLRILESSAEYQPLFAFGIGALTYAVAMVTGANLFLAGFAGGVTVASASPETRAAFGRFGELVTELLKLGALLLFGLLVSIPFLAEVPVSGYLLAAGVLLVARPVAVGLALVGSALDRRERLVAAWFGPKGFASVVYGLLVLQSGGPSADRIFHLVGLCVALSILAHSSTDVAIARRFGAGEEEDRGHSEPAPAADPASADPSSADPS